MGLDMYLTAERYFWHNETKPQLDQVPAPYEAKTVTVEAAYWRKANAIHDWFVSEVQEGVDECQSHYVSREKLTELVDLCKTVLASRDEAEDLLPTASGFFFGGTEYDEWYFENVQRTVDQIELALKTLPEGEWGFNYRSSW